MRPASVPPERVFQLGYGARLPGETLQKGGVLQEVGGQHLDGHIAAHAGLMRFVDHRHAAPPDLLGDGVGANLLANQSAHGALFLLTIWVG